MAESLTIRRAVADYGWTLSVNAAGCFEFSGGVEEDAVHPVIVDACDLDQFLADIQQLRSGTASWRPADLTRILPP